jgi:hypothetical protein
MRIVALTTFALLALAAPAAAQDPGALPRDLSQRVNRILNDGETRRYETDAEIEEGAEVDGDVAVLDGDLVLGGRVDGDVVVVNGSLWLADGAEITGVVIVVGGEIEGERDATVDGEMIVYAEPVSHCRRGARVDVSGDCGALADASDVDVSVDAGEEGDWEAVDDEDRDGDAEFVVATGRSYNRVEGLPIKFGPSVETGGSNPLRVRAMAIFRTEDGPELGPDQWGYDARIEQFFGGRRAMRVGARAYQLVDPIEGWHLSDLENSLSTFFLHRDFRDHYEREGWTAYATLAPESSPFSLTGEYRSERHRSLAAGSPWSIFDNSEPWRPQPLVGEGRLRSVAGIVEIDSRSDERDPASGWYVRAEVEQALRSRLVRPAGELTGPLPGGGTAVPSEEFGGDWLAATVDVRRYNRISPSSRLNLRLAGAASLTGENLPPQRQHALGGEGTLPGFPLFALDCGARSTPLRRAGGDADSPPFFARYGCDSFALFQAEYRGDVSFRVDLGTWGDWDDDEEDEEGGDDEKDGWRGEHIDADFGWVFFVDAGAGWSGANPYRDEDTAVDVGAGILLGDLGIYFAVPVADNRERGGVNFFIRLAPRF